MTVAYVVRPIGQTSRTFTTALAAAEALLEADRTECVTVLAGTRERDMNQKELRLLGAAIPEARARKAQMEVENSAIAKALGLQGGRAALDARSASGATLDGAG